MALQVWLPLDGDLRNQGLADIEVTNNGATINDNGKIGKCYSFNGSNNYLRFKYPMSNLINSWSFCCWVKFNQNKTETLISSRKNTEYGMSIFHIGGQLRFDNGTDSATSQYNFSPTITLNIWQHIAVIQDQTTRKLYINGNLVSTINAMPVVSGNTAQYILVGASSASDSTPNANYLNGYLNDFRIYNHALSAKEVKELSKGLILHYPMNDKYIESTTNLITSEDCLSNTCYNAATSKYGYGANSDMYKIVTIFQGQKGTKVYMGTNGNNARPYSYINDMFVSDGTNKPAYKTLSFDYYTNIGTYISPYKLGSGNGTATWKVFNGITTTGTYTNSGNIPIATNQWNHIEITFHGTSTANCEWGYIINGAQHVSNTNNFWFYANMQLEVGDHATGYTFPGTTRLSSTSILDCAPAGNTNDGTIVGTIIAAVDSPRYEACTYVQSSSPTTNNNTGLSYIKADIELNQPTAMTVSWWAKPLSGYGGSTGHAAWCTSTGTEPTDYNITAFHHRDAGFDICPNSGSAVRLTFNQYTANQWHHYAIVYDGLKAFAYKDSVQISSATLANSITPLKSFTKLFIGFSKAGGVWRKTQGYYSDFRIYCTALSAEDIKELYNTAAQVDKDGNVYAYEFKE